MSKQILDIKLSECGDFVYIKFTDGEYFKISSYDWYGLDFAKKKAETVSDSQFSMLVMLDECSKAKNKLISLLSYSGNSKKGFAQKLKRYGFSEESINYALAFAEEKKLISDENYAEALIHELVNIKKYGPIRVKQEMYRHGISENLTNSMIEVYFEKDENGLSQFDKNMLDMAIIKSKKFDLNDKSSKEKLFASLNRLGYEYTRISKLRFNKK